MYGRQFDTMHGNSDDKAALVKQLSKSFHAKDLAWIDSTDVRVTRTSVSPDHIDWEGRESWRATHEPGKVKKKRQEIKHGNDRPVALVDRPGHDNLFVMDGHHHTEAYTQLLGQDKQNKHVRALHGQMPAYEIHVNRTRGPWDTLHTKEMNTPDA